MSATITLAMFLQLAGANCDIAPHTLASLSFAESGGPGRTLDPLAININLPASQGGGTVRGIRTKAQAIAKARDLQRAGIDFDAGVGQINVRNWRWLGVTAETVFNPADNIAAQCRLLQSYSRYNTGSPVRGVANGYVQRVVRGAASVREAVRQPAGQTPRRDARTCPERPRVAVWGTSPRSARCRSG